MTYSSRLVSVWPAVNVTQQANPTVCGAFPTTSLHNGSTKKVSQIKLGQQAPRWPRTLCSFTFCLKVYFNSNSTPCYLQGFCRYEVWPIVETCCCNLQHGLLLGRGPAPQGDIKDFSRITKTQQFLLSWDYSHIKPSNKNKIAIYYFWCYQATIIYSHGLNNVNMPSLNSVCLREVLFLLFFLRARDPKPFTCFSHFICNLSYMILNMVICNFFSATERRPTKKWLKSYVFLQTRNDSLCCKSGWPRGHARGSGRAVGVGECSSVWASDRKLFG